MKINEIITEATGLPGDTSTLLSLLSEMANLAKKLRPEVHRIGSTNDRIMFLMKELQKAGIDPNKVLG